MFIVFTFVLVGILAPTILYIYGMLLFSNRRSIQGGGAKARVKSRIFFSSTVIAVSFFAVVFREYFQITSSSKFWVTTGMIVGFGCYLLVLAAFIALAVSLGQFMLTKNEPTSQAEGGRPKSLSE